MKRNRSLSALFASLLGSSLGAGCGPQVEIDDGDTGDGGTSSDDATTGVTTATTSASTTATTLTTSVSVSASASDTMTTGPLDTGEDAFDSGDCPMEIYTDVYEIPRSEIEQWLDENGQVIRGACWNACEAAGQYEEIIACQILPSADSDDGTPPPEPATDTGSGTIDGGDADSGDVDPLLLLECEWRWYCLGGRGHAALRSRPSSNAADPLGRWAAAAAHAEAASVAAFLALRRELVAHEAPMLLCERALVAAREEVVHARMMTRIAVRRGALVQRPRFGPVTVRDLESIAVENIVEGCVRETWAALEATHQAHAAADPDVRAAMRRIAADETRHAELARDIDAWVRTRLDQDARARVDRARATAIRGLLRSIGRHRDAELCRRAGLPRPPVARRLATALRDELWC